jgi:hypothetical protein
MPLLFLAALLPLFCTGQTAVPAGSRYYPLALGNIWTYRIHHVSPKGKDSKVEWRVTHAGETYQVWPKPTQSDDEAMELAVTPEGIREISSNVLLLKFPIKTGETWSGEGESGNKSRTFRVLTANKPCSVGGLNISDCVTIEDEDATATGLKTVTTYGRDIGPVQYVYYRKKAGKELLLQCVTLTSHKFRGV